MTLNKVALCLSVALAISGCGEKLTAQSHIDNAKNYIAQNKVKEVEIELKNAVQLEPKNGEVRYLLGEFYLSQGDALSAFKELDKAQTLKYKNKKLQVLISRAHLLTEDFDSILAKAESANLLEKELKVQYLAYKTLAAIKTNDHELAKKSAQEASELIPANPYSILAQAYIEISDSNPTKAVNKLGYAPAYRINEGILEAMPWYLENVS